MKYRVSITVQMPQGTSVFVEAESPEAARALVQSAIDKDEWSSWVWQNAEEWQDEYEAAYDLKTTYVMEDEWETPTSQEVSY